MQESKFVRLMKLFLVFAKIGLFTFGGGMAMISLFSSELVSKRKWISDEEMLDIVAVAESTPGPLAINTATYIGFKKEGILGGIIASLGVIFPSLVIICIVAFFYDQFIAIELVKKAFNGIVASVIILIMFSVIKLSKGIKNSGIWYVNLILILLTIFFRLVLPNISTILLILVGGIVGIVLYSLLLNKGGNE